MLSSRFKSDLRKHFTYTTMHIFRYYHTMKIKVEKLRQIVKEELEFVRNMKSLTMITEEITDKDLVMLRQIIRFELASVFYDLYRRKNAWAK